MALLGEAPLLGRGELYLLQLCNLIDRIAQVERCVNYYGKGKWSQSARVVGDSYRLRAVYGAAGRLAHVAAEVLARNDGHCY